MSLLLIFLNARGYLENNLRQWLEGAVSPLQYVVNSPSRLLDKILSTFTSQASLLKENQTLKTQLILLKLQYQRFLDLENENRQLRALLNASENAQMQVKMAEVLLVASSRNANEWILNKGSRDGVYVGQAVLDAKGILGQVIMLGPNTSRMMLISDSRSSVPVENLRTGLRSEVQGKGVNRPLSLVFIPKTETVKAGDILVSSGVGDHFPKGYPVGKVLKVMDRAGEQFLSIDVLPIAQLDHEKFVLLLWPHGFSSSLKNNAHD